jgi:hypothetical protein
MRPKAMSGWLFSITGIVLIAAVVRATAAPLVPPGDLPGRERYRFTPSPLDRFMQPNPRVEPLLRWDCGPRRPSRSPPRARRNRYC